MGLKQREKKKNKDKSTGDRINKIGLVTLLGINIRENRDPIYYIKINLCNVTWIKKASSRSLHAGW